MSKVFLGVDISKAKFDIALLMDNKFKTRKFENSVSGFRELLEWLQKKEVSLQSLYVCMEATGRYSEGLAHYLFERGCFISVVNPARIKGFAQTELSRNKTDKKDSQLIAKFCKLMQPELWKPSPPLIRTLQDLLRRLKSLKDMHQQEANRLEGNVSASIKASLETVMIKLSEEIRSIEKQVAEHIDKDPDLRDKQELLSSIPGIGKATIAQIIAFINIQDFKNAKQLAAFIGLNPKHRQSGSSVRGTTRLSKVGDSNIRKVFYFPAIVAKRHNPIIRSFCERLYARRKPTMLIIGAAMRKLVHIIYGVLKSKSPFDPNLVAT